MTEEILKTLDFGDSLNIISQASKDLHEKGINNFIVGEITTTDETYSRYIYMAGIKLQNTSPESELVLDLNDKEVLTNYYGGIAAATLDIFISILRNRNEREPDLAEVIHYMLECHRYYRKNVQPE